MILLTGVAGFIGMHVARHLLAQGKTVLGVDHMGPCAEPALKEGRLAQLLPDAQFRFARVDLAQAPAVEELFAAARFECVIHLAAQTGVRYSATHPHECVMSNVVAFGNVIECCRKHGVGHLVYASSSSTYGANRQMPFSEHHPADHPVSLYAATKRSDELLAHSYSHLYGLPTTGLRFFTVYGPWGRPDMAPMLFAHAIVQGRPIEVYNGGKMLRDFTFVDDVVESVARLAAHPATPDPGFDAENPDPATSYAPYRIYNVGNQQPVELTEFIDELERALGRKAERLPRPMPGADMVATCADTRDLEHAIHWTPATPLATGIDRFVRWYQGYYA
ncbi:NAD-dependent epimerase/dehydratase family protein [Massilia agilis]|uniref:NAD-dependent epimerase/dehydratase family protein n=1 Tax=Massilia agilis TaxID=1811226 RepID=A0ABT2D9W8_9BURK|nr:NAD-dependent epimerase/dehydratase family protein [Massilia agilis]MCS0807947.1 NAD-dependent epimerase/dehydratase family protein [Massilia agilis]